MKLWLLEVNGSPGLGYHTERGNIIDKNVAQEMFNIARFHLPEESAKIIAQHFEMGDTKPLTFNPDLYDFQNSEKDDKKQKKMLKLYKTSPMKAREQIIQSLTTNDVLYLIRLEDELAKADRFKRIFPNENSAKYLEFYEELRYYTILAYAWENKNARNRTAGREIVNELCQKKIHLKSK